MNSNHQKNTEFVVITNLIRIFLRNQQKIERSGKWGLILSAPPAWGKTALIQSLFSKDSHLNILYISPLKALALELLEKAREWEMLEEVLLLKTSSISKKRENNSKLYIITPETLFSQFKDEVEENLFENQVDLIVIDEFHLFTKWNSFRPSMDEVLFFLGTSSIPIIHLTATIDVEENFLYEYYFPSFQDLYYLNLGNFRLKNAPIISMAINPMFRFFAIFLIKLLLLWFRRIGPILLFVRTRREVDRWVRWGKYYDINILGCVGGETQKFIENLKFSPDPRMIVSTSCLSHGVNLPGPRIVVISYEEKDNALFLQMCGRGGRRDESSFTLFYMGKKRLNGLKMLY